MNANAKVPRTPQPSTKPDAGAATRVVALLRGVNVSGANRLKMADLRTVVTSLGGTDVATYLQSGNVVFTTTLPKDGLGDIVSARLAEQCGLTVPVLVRTGDDMASVVAANPYRRDDPTKVVVLFCDAALDGIDLDLDAFAPEGLAVSGREIYLDLPFGQARSPLLAALDKAKVIDRTATVRNWRTVLALAEMTAR